MNLKKIKIIIKKEWAEVFKNRMVIFTVAFLPLIMTALPLIILYSTRDTGAVGSSDATQAIASGLCTTDPNDPNCLQVTLVTQFLMMFMLIPLTIPTTIAAYSIVGEKNNKSLEPLLATPISTNELLLGKGLSALIPALIATFGSFILFLVGAWIILIEKSILFAFMDYRWMASIFIIGPLLAFFAVNLSLMVSSRVNDPRAAEQISVVVIIPVLAIFFGQISGLIVLNNDVVTITAIVMLLLDFVIYYFANKVFQREIILTRWK
ncbi:ABC transporter permease subunit [Chloroflexota bacterium]